MIGSHLRRQPQEAQRMGDFGVSRVGMVLGAQAWPEADTTSLQITFPSNMG